LRAAPGRAVGRDGGRHLGVASSGRDTGDSVRLKADVVYTGLPWTASCSLRTRGAPAAGSDGSATDLLGSSVLGSYEVIDEAKLGSRYLARKAA
jgi:hypothetical protein